MDHQPTTRTPLTGELIVRRGPDRGTSRPLLVPFTLIGRAEHCDLRILDFLVRPVHCAVSITPDGPHLRSLGGPTIVNGLPTQERLLQQGDVVTIGPIELEVHWYLPPAPTPNANVVQPQETTRLHQPHPDTGVPYPVRKIARMKNRLVQGRLQLLRERDALRDDVARQLDTIGELRLEGEQAKMAAVAELAQLRQLRRQFLKRWKRYWRRKRLQHEHDQHTLQQAQGEFARQQQEWQAEQARFALERDALQQAHDECRQRCTHLETELAQRTVELDRREAELQVREQQHAQRLATVNDLHAEIAGLEARVQHLRTRLPHEGPTPTPTNNVPPVHERWHVLQTVATTLTDQQQALAEQVQLLLQTRADHQQTQATLATELESLTVDVLRREHDLARTDHTIAEQQRYLESWQARLLDQQIDVERQITHAHASQQHAAQREATIARIGQRWATRRQAEFAHLQAELEQLALLRHRVEFKQLELLEREARWLAHAQQSLLERHPERRLQAIFAQRAEEQQATLQTIRAESAALQQLYDQTQERLLSLATEQREWSATRVAHDHEPAPSLPIDREAALATAERHVEELRAEVQRLTQLLEHPTASVGPRRAA